MEQGSERKSRRARGVPVCIRHEDFSNRFDYFSERDIVDEWGIAVQELGDTSIPQVVQKRVGKNLWALLPCIVDEWWRSSMLGWCQSTSTNMV